MLIADEVQSGAGRTGTLFAMEQMGVAADITTFAKSIAGGFPLAGVTRPRGGDGRHRPRRTGRHLRRQPHRLRRRPGGITDFRAGESAGKANQLGDTLRQGLLAIAEDHPEIGDVRGLGR